jgi:hypothetical protein
LAQRGCSSSSRTFTREASSSSAGASLI